MISLGECYADLKGNKNEGWKKKRTNEKMEKNAEMKSKIVHCQMGLRRGSTGIFTCCPSTTPFGLILGPDSPSVDEPCGGTLRFSGHWILTNVCVTQADILASASSTRLLARVLPPKAERSPTDAFLLFTSHSFGRSLSPVHLRRKSARSVSYLSYGLPLLNN